MHTCLHACLRACVCCCCDSPLRPRCLTAPRTRVQVGLTFPLGLVLGPATNLLTFACNFSIGTFFTVRDTNAPGLLLAVVLSLLLTAIMANLREPPSYDESLGTVAAGQGGAADEAGKEAQYPSDDEAGGEGGGALLDTPPPPSSDAGPSVLADIARPTVSLWWEPGGGGRGARLLLLRPPSPPLLSESACIPLI